MVMRNMASLANHALLAKENEHKTCKLKNEWKWKFFSLESSVLAAINVNFF